MLSTTASYALRALSCLASMSGSNAILGRELAELTGIPANYLAKILLILKRGGLVQATRGTGGGYRLDRQPENVTLMQIVELFDLPDEMSGCFLYSSRPCSESHPCPAYERWREVRESYTKFLETTTLDQISTSDDAPHEPCRKGEDS